MMPDFASEILTGWLVPMNKKEFTRGVYPDLYFSLMIMSSWDTIEFRRVLSSMRLRSPSCWIATRGLFLNTSVAKVALLDPSAFPSNDVVYPWNRLSTIFKIVDFPVPAEP